MAYYGENTYEIMESNPGDINEKSMLLNSILLQKPKRIIIVEPVLFMYFTAFLGSIPTIEQYLYHRLGNESLLGALQSGNCSVDKNSKLYKSLLFKQEETSKWLMYINMATYFPAIICAMFIGPYSDRFGRRPALLLASFGGAVKSIITALVIYLNLPIHCLLIANTFEGCCGTFLVMIMASCSYIADITSGTNRGLRMTIAESVRELAGAVVQIALGYWIGTSSNPSDFLYPYLAIVALYMLNLIYVIFFVPETVVRNPLFSKEKLSAIFKQVQKTFTIYINNDENNRRPKVLLLLIVFFVLSTQGQATLTMRILYAMNKPLCWGPVIIGYFTGYFLFTLQIGAILGVFIFRKCISEVWIAQIGVASHIGALIINGIAHKDWQMFLVPIVGIFTVTANPMIQTMLSKLVSKKEQGSVFAGLAMVQALCNFLSSSIFKIYEATFDIYPGLIFLILACAFIVVMILLVVLAAIFKNDKYMEQRGEDEKSIRINIPRSYLDSRSDAIF